VVKNTSNLSSITDIHPDHTCVGMTDNFEDTPAPNEKIDYSVIY